jgi:TPP-dependent pyruvate/acetoin dehydrogenase alpha subunit
MTGIKTIQAARVAGKNGFSLISDEKFRELYAALLLCRMLDERLQENVDYERWAGCEAGSAGVAACLRSGDTIAPTPRGLLADYLLNASLLVANKATDAIAAQLAVATGDALRHKLEKQTNVTVVFTRGDEPDDACEAFTIADRHSLPILYVLEGGQPLTEVCGGIPVICVDGCDAVAVYRVAHESIVRAREGGGPTIMECASWPVSGESQDPLARLEHYLADKKLFRQSWKQQLEKKYHQTLDEVVRNAALSEG